MRLFKTIVTYLIKLIKHDRSKNNQMVSMPEDREPKLVLSSNVERTIRTESLQAYKSGLETCGFLLTKGKNGATRISEATGPGKNPRKTAVMCEPDYSVLVPYLAKGLKVVGEWHMHLGYGAGLSSGDERTLFNASALIPEFVALVVNMKTDDTFDMAAFSIKEGQIKNIEVEIDDRLARISELVDPKILASKIVSILGGGSGGSKCAEMLARTGVQNFILVDLANEKLERVNLTRHIGFECDLGKPKTKVIARVLRLIYRKIRVAEKHFDLTKDEDRLTQVVAASDLVMACPGDPSANTLINKVCLELKKPVVFAGAFEKGKGGYVLGVDPADRDAACFSCLFDIGSIPDSNATIRASARNYGIDETQLHAQQGLCLDVNQIAILQTRLALCMLLKNTEHEAAGISRNFIWVDNRELQIKMLSINRRKDCYVCSREGWLASLPVKSDQGSIEPISKGSFINTSVKSERVSLFERIKHLVVFKGKNKTQK